MRKIMVQNDHLIPFFTNLLNLAKDVYTKASKERPELMRMWATVLSLLKDALTTPELQSLPEVKKEIKDFIDNCEEACLASTELKKLFGRLGKFKHSLKYECCSEAHEVHEKIHNFFKCYTGGEK